MDYKLEYMERLFAKISKKKTESYVISRIWHQLNDDRVKFVVQQYIRRTHDKYALADLYLPQLNILIEINEPFHKNNGKHSKKCTFYTLRFGCSFAAVNTIKPQLL